MGRNIAPVQPPISAQIIRLITTLEKVPGLGAIVAESLTSNSMDSHRSMGKSTARLPELYLFIDEAKRDQGVPLYRSSFGDGIELSHPVR